LWFLNLQLYPIQDIEETLTGYSAYGKLTTLRLNTHTAAIFARKVVGDQQVKKYSKMLPTIGLVSNA
jgi:hypothetical protein